MTWRGLLPLRYVPIGIAAFAALWLAGSYSYLLFHCVVETLGITVAAAMFAVAWNTRRVSGNGYLTLLGIAYLFVAGVDFVHMLAYKGMGVFAGRDADLPTQLWVAARAIEAISLLVSPIYLARRVRPWTTLGVYAVVTAALLVVIFPLRAFPACFVERGPSPGLTTFKIWTEYAVCGILAVAFAAAWRLRDRFSPTVLRLVLWAIGVSIVSELAFTRYVSVYGDFNMIGHVLKAASFVLMFGATVTATLRDPYEVLFRDLRLQDEALRASEQRARENAEQLAEANRIKDEFLATLSHELRTPLHAMVGWSDMLVRGQLDEPGARRAYEAIARNARTQAQLVSDVLDVSRIVAGKLRLNAQRVELTTVLQNALDVVRPAADAKRIRLETSIPAAPVPVHGDPDRLQQVLWNVLSNAVKFTPTGGRVRVQLQRIDSRWRITVRDSGCGIDPAFLPFVFERFRQADSSMSRKHGGLGLGLAIVRHLVELHGGTVQADSDGEGTGATFTVLLPVPVIDGGREQAGRDRVAVSSEQGIRVPRALDGVSVVAVDDEADARELIQTVLEHEGAVVRVAASAAEAYELLRAAAPNVIISDIGMPGEDGFALIKRVRACPSLAAVPAIALTAYGRDEDRLHVIAAGFQQHVPKPAVADDLVAMVASLAGASAAPSSS